MAQTDIAQNDEIPLLVAKIKLLIADDQGGHLYAKLLCLLLRRRDGLFRRIKSSDGPSLLSQVQRVASLTHSDVKCPARRDAFRYLDEERIRFGIERGLRRREDTIPSVHFESLPLLGDDPKLPLDLGSTQTFAGKHLPVLIEEIDSLRLRLFRGPRPELLVDLHLGRLRGGLRLGSRERPSGQRDYKQRDKSEMDQ